MSFRPAQILRRVNSSRVFFRLFLVRFIQFIFVYNNHACTYSSFFNFRSLLTPFTAFISLSHFCCSSCCTCTCTYSNSQCFHCCRCPFFRLCPCTSSSTTCSSSSNRTTSTAWSSCSNGRNCWFRSRGFDHWPWHLKHALRRWRTCRSCSRGSCCCCPRTTATIQRH